MESDNNIDLLDNQIYSRKKIELYNIFISNTQDKLPSKIDFDNKFSIVQKKINFNYYEDNIFDSQYSKLDSDKNYNFSNKILKKHHRSINKNKFNPKLPIKTIKNFIIHFIQFKELR